MVEHSQGTLAVMGGAAAIAGIGELTGGGNLLNGLILLGTGVGMIILRAYLRFRDGIVPESIQMLSKETKKLLKKKNVIGVAKGKKIVDGIETDEDAIVAFVILKVLPSVLKRKDMIPKSIDGISTDVIETEEFYAYTTSPEERQRKWRPSPPGVSIGHKKITAGTFGCVVTGGDGKRYILSNNHILANSNDARQGDSIRQPGPIDGSLDFLNTIASLHRWIAIKFNDVPSTCPNGRAIAAFFNFWYWLFRRQSRFKVVIPQTTDANLVDAAIAYPIREDIVTDEVLDIGIPFGIKEAIRDMPVTKSGRTTGLTEGEVFYTDGTITVNYGGGRKAIFEDQIFIKPGAFSSGGDSGSAVFTIEDGKPYLVGLVFAGSITYSIMNRIQNVFDLLNITL